MIKIVSRDFFRKKKSLLTASIIRAQILEVAKKGKYASAPWIVKEKFVKKFGLTTDKGVQEKEPLVQNKAFEKTRKNSKKGFNKFSP